MKKAKSPGYQRYPKDFLADTALMTAEQVGAYQLLLDYAWVGLPGFKQGQLPAGDEQLARLARVTEQHWKEIKNVILNCFIISENSDQIGAVLEHKRIKRELANQRAYRKLQSEKGKSGARKRWPEDSNGHSNGHNPALPVLIPKTQSSTASSCINPEEVKNTSSDGHTVEVTIWTVGVELLIGAGLSNERARGFLGKQIKLSSEEIVAGAIGTAYTKKPANLPDYIAGIVKADVRRKAGIAGIPVDDDIRAVVDKANKRN